MSSTWYQISKLANPASFTAPYLETINFTPPDTAFCDKCLPGLSTYPQPGSLEQWQEELKKHGNPSWASSEGTAMDPAEAKKSGNGMDMEGYLGNLFNHGAVLATVFGWGVGDVNNPFRKIAENENALAAYRKFLEGKRLREAPIPTPAIPPAGLIDNIHRIQAELPNWIQKNGPAAVKDDVKQLEQSIREKHFDLAALVARIN